MKVRVVRGKAKWRAHFARLTLGSAPEMFPALFGPRVKDVLAYTFDRPHNLFNYQYSYFALAKGEPVGMVMINDYEDKPGTFLPMAFDLLKAMGPGIIPHASGILKTDSLMGQTEKDQCYFWGFCVDEKYRGVGVGTQLLERTCEDAKERGQTHMLLDVETWNKDAMRFYKRNGFKKKGKMYEIPLGKKTFKYYAMLKEL